MEIATSSANDEKDEKKAKSTKIHFSRRQWVLIGTLLTANFVNTITFNCMDAFYPKEAHSRSIETSKIGLIIGVYQLSRFVMAPIAGKYIVNIGSMLTFYVGLFVTAGTAIGFGMLSLLPNGALFFWCSLAIRVFQALARTCFVVSSLTIAAQLFPDNVALLGGLLETFAGVGHISGPVIGSALFELGGFMLPNVTMGTLMALTGCLFMLLMDCKIAEKRQKNAENGTREKGQKRQRRELASIIKNIKIHHNCAGDVDIQRSTRDWDNSSADSSTSNQSFSMEDKDRQNRKRRKRLVDYSTILSHAEPWLIILVITLRGVTCSFYQAPLPEHLNSLSSSALLVGLMFTIMSVSYFVSAPLLAILVECRDDQRAPRVVILIGSGLTICSTLLMGPFPLSPLEKSVPLLCLSFALLGVSASALYIPVFQQCTNISKKYDNEEDHKCSTRIYACLFGLVQSASTLGSFVGATFGGFGAQHIGFPWTCTIVGLAHLIFVLTHLVHSIFVRIMCRSK